jgi:hypothetical protein
VRGPLRFAADPIPAALSVERLALREAITAHAQATALHERLTASTGWSGSAQCVVRNAEAAVEAATAALAEAQAAAADRLIDPDAPAPTRTTGEARAAVAEAGDALAVAKLARATLEARLPEALEAQRRAAERVETAARAVLRAEAQGLATALAADLEQAQRDMVAKSTLLEWFAGNSVFPVETEPGYSFGRPVDLAIRRTLVRADGLADRWHGLDAPDAAAPWRLALAALMADASTALPA